MGNKTWLIKYTHEIEIGVPDGEDPESAALAYLPEDAEITETIEQPMEFDELEDR